MFLEDSESNLQPTDRMTEALAQGVDAIVQPIERVFFGVGANQPWQRFVIGAALGAAPFLIGFQPQAMFQNGVVRPWSLLADASQPQQATPTSTPWFFLPLATGLIAGTLI